MAGWAGKFASVVLIFVATWGCAIMYWRNSGSVPTGMDMLLYLGLLPAGVSSAGFLVSGVVRQGADKALRKVTDTSSETSAAPAESRDGRVKNAASVALMAADMNLGLGLQCPELLALASTPPRPRLSKRFRDTNNLPVRSCEAEALDDQQVLSEREQGIDTAEHERRATALLAPVVGELASAVAGMLPPMAAAEEVVVAGLRRNDEGRVEKILTVELLLPGGWSDGLRPWLQEWLTQALLATGVDGRRFEAKVTVVGDAESTWRHVLRVCETLEGDAAHWHLLLACSSSIDGAVVEGWKAGGLLATSRNPDGKVPGEGAAGVVLANVVHGEEDSARVWRLNSLELGSAQAVRPSEQRRQLLASIQAWFQEQAIDATATQFVLHDAGQGSDAIIDAAMVGTALNPDMDFGASNLAVGRSSGELGPVQVLADLALALARVRSHADAVLVLAGAESQQRMFTLVEPFTSSHQATQPSPAT